MGLIIPPVPRQLERASKLTGSANMSFSAKRACISEFNLSIPDLVSGHIHVHTLVLNDTIGIGFKAPVFFRTNENELHLKALSQKGCIVSAYHLRRFRKDDLLFNTLFQQPMHTDVHCNPTGKDNGFVKRNPLEHAHRSSFNLGFRVRYTLITLSAS